MLILGLHGGITQLQHDPSATLIGDGLILAAAEEERFSRVKSALGQLPIYATAACLKQAGVTMKDVDLVVHSGSTFADLEERIRRYLIHYFGRAPKILMVRHQEAHLASAYYGSGFDHAMVLSADGYGDQESGAFAIGEGRELTLLEGRGADVSLGQFYAAITSYLGFSVNEDEYKVMGLAPYGKPGVDLSRYLEVGEDDYRIDSSLWERKPKPMSRYEPWYNDSLVEHLGPARRRDDPLTDRHRDLAYATQEVFERAMVALVTRLHRQTGMDSLCLAGGCALNCSANRVLAELPFVRRLFVQPAASDRGISLGCALLGAAQSGIEMPPALRHVYLGPDYPGESLLGALKLTGHAYSQPQDLASVAARLLAKGKIVARFEGRAEYGPRALGNRTIMADPRSAEMKDVINSKVKFREEFRPFAPAVLAERCPEIFEIPIENGASPYMTMALPVKPGWLGKLKAVTHVQGTARVQAVYRDVSPGFYDVISTFDRLTGVPALLNTSFNVRGEPIVETPLNALATFAATGIDALLLGPYLLVKPGVDAG